MQRWLEWLPAVHRGFDLPENPGIGHRPATNQDTITTSVAEPVEGLLDRHDVAAAGYGNADGILNLLYQIPISQSSITLLFGATVKRDVLDTAGFGQLSRFD